ncbi:hypothetical protein PR048_028973 [Dryococelus australis]|uniref:Integrase catalytic domain-containing protein n=1 Tax=Dryococelus australis TaxID=614101 RepID=A0ABQ9GC25_9NEOP|nr:hypothetical protein PR048_028973 [Dryococelus australis]
MDVEKWAIKGETVGTINKGQEKQKGLKENLSKEMKPQVDQEPIRQILHSQPSVVSLEEYMSEIRTLPHSVVIKTTNGGEIIATRAGKFMGNYGSGTISFEALIVPGLKNNLKRVLQVLNLPFSEEKCPQYLDGKAKRLPLKKNEKFTQSIGELLHSDISGPVKTATNEGERYFHVIVDDFSHFTTMYLLKTKSEAEENLMNFIEMVKTQHGVKSKRIRLDNGGEFRSNSFEKFCADKGIIIEYTTPNSLQQNSKAERMNLTLMNKDPLKDKIVSSRDVTFNESKVGVGNDTAQYQGINTEEENENLKGKDSTEVKYDTEENGTKEVTKHEPQDYEDAIKLGNGWEAIESKIKALELHKTRTPTVLPPGEKAIKTKWIFKTKKDGLMKARLVAKGFQEDPVNNVYVPVARLPTIPFLNGYVDDDIYIKTPDRAKNEQGKVLKLKRSLHGLRSAPRKWNKRLQNFKETHGMKRSASDFCLYIAENVWLIIWVDDILLTGEKTQVEN